QCSLPILEGLFPRTTEKIVLDLAFTSCSWQVLSSLRMHTDATLDFFKTVTTNLGYHLRQFAKESRKYDTTELPHEARKRKHCKKKQNDSMPEETTNVSTRIRRFNNETIKTHALGDFVWAIKYFGTADGWDTRIVSEPIKQYLLSSHFFQG
ncbi:hypothetical protein K435DRAFT_667807, partial [Dendrothele bispora CBS 962.96]